MGISDATETILSVNHPDAYAELSRLRARETVLVEALTELHTEVARFYFAVNESAGVTDTPLVVACRKAVNALAGKEVFFGKALATISEE